jgi:hypothetical protein
MRFIDWVGIIFLCTILGIIALASGPKKQPANDMPVAAPMLVGGGKLGHGGEWITRCTDNSKVCRLRHAIDAGTSFDPQNCDDWTEPEPISGQTIADSPARVWAAGMPGFVWLHFEDGWRPRQPQMACPKWLTLTTFALALCAQFNSACTFQEFWQTAPGVMK